MQLPFWSELNSRMPLKKEKMNKKKSIVSREAVGFFIAKKIKKGDKKCDLKMRHTKDVL